MMERIDRRLHSSFDSAENHTSGRVACRNPFEHNLRDQTDLPGNQPDPAGVCLNTSMIDLRKATKGRRMSKKTRKKSHKPPARKTTRTASKAPAKQPASKSKPSSASKNSKSKQTRASHVAASKTLKPAAGARSKRKAAVRSALAEGAKAPAFRLPRDGGDMISLADFSGKKLVLFFYPRADTPGCTREAIDFTRLRGAFTEAGTAVVGVSGDPPRTQEAFRNKHQLGVPLASDEKHEMLQAYGAWGEKSMYGRTFLGILRTTVLIGTDGRIARIWRNVRVDGHADEVLAAAQAV
jgi:thioredoxin-dependent peroxiredoxin